MERLGPAARVAIAVFATVVGISAMLAVLSAVEMAGTPGGTGTEGVVAGEVVVSAAASLTDAITAVAVAFEQAHPGADVVLNLGGSATLAAQLDAGAPVDVVVLADPQVVADLEADGLLDGPPVTIASTSIVLAVPRGNPTGVDALADLADEGLFVGVCAAEQPCGRYARDALALVGLDADAVADSLEPDARALLAKLVAGELDAGIVYATDALAAGDALEILPVEGPTASYPAAVLAGAPNPVAATTFLDFLAGPVGSEALRAAGFDTPTRSP